MNIVKRAFVQIRANFGKSILVFIIFLLVMSAVSAIFITTALYEKTLDATFENGTVQVTIDPEFPKTLVGMYNFDWEQRPEITLSQYKEIAKLDSVVDSNISITSWFDMEQFSIQTASGEMLMDYQFVQSPETMTEIYYKEAISYNYDRDAFKSNPNSIIINDQIMAEKNLEVGDTITLDLTPASVSNAASDELREQELTIVGTYTVEPTAKMIETEKLLAEKYEEGPDLDFFALKNTLILPYAKGEEIAKIYEDIPEAYRADAVYSLESLEHEIQFKSDVETLLGYPVDVNYYLIDDEENTLADILSEIGAIKSFLNYIVSFTVSFIVVLLTVIITLFVRGRKKEMGILVALGEKRRNIYLQLVFEQLILLGFAFIIAYPVIYMYLNSILQEYSTLSLGFDFIPFVQTISIGIIIVGLITLIPAIYTLRVTPKKILL